MLHSLVRKGRKARTARMIRFLNWQIHVVPYPFVFLRAIGIQPASLIPYPHRVGQGKMSHLSREKLDLLTRTKKIVGQLEAVGRALDQDEPCSEVLQRLAAARGAINSLMGELMEDHIRNHMPRKTKSAEEAADDLIEIVRTYLK